jgi:putative Mg2+ transporter-C (MgtC) family protein
MEHIFDAKFFITQSEIIKFITAIILCGLIGAEREYRSKSAGLKTMMMIGLGSTLFTILSVKIGLSSQDRIASNIVTGIGFLGAGVIWKEGISVKGLTTACVIWVVAAIGMAIGSGFIYQAIAVTGIVLIALLTFPFIERTVELRFTKRSYRIVKKYEDQHLDNYEEIFKKFRLKPNRGTHHLADGVITGIWDATGRPKDHEKFVEMMLKDKNITEFEF